MQFTIDKDIFTENLNITAKGTAPKTLYSALGGVLVTVEEDTATFTGYDMDFGVRLKSKVYNAKNGSIVISEPRIMAQIVSRMQGDVLFEVVQSKEGSSIIKLSSGKSISHLPCQSADDYPNVVKFNRDEIFSVSEKILKNILKQVNHAVTPHGGNPEIAGIRIEFNPEIENLYFVGTDAARLAFRFIPKSEVPEIFQFAVTVPERVILEVINKLSEESDSKINIILDKNLILFEKDEGDFEVFSRLLDSQRYLNYLKITNFVQEKIVEINVFEIRNILGRMMPLLSDKMGSYVVFEFSKGGKKVELSCKTTIGSFREEMDVNTVEGNFEQNFKIAFNPKYIYDAAFAATCDNFYIYIKNELSPIKILPEKNSKENFTFLIVPVRI